MPLDLTLNMSVVPTMLRSIAFAFLLTFLFSFFPLDAAIYEPTEESRTILLASLEQATKEDRPVLHNQIAESYTYADSSKLREYAEKALSEARNLRNATEEVRALRNLGTSYHISGDLDMALRSLNEAIQIKGCEDVSLISNVKLALALIYISGELWEPAEILLNEAYAGFLSVGSEFDMARVRLNQTRVALKRGSLSDAVNLFEDSKHHASISQSDKLKGHLKMVEGLIFIEQERYQDAITSFDKSITFFKAGNFSSPLCESLVQQSYCYQQVGALEQSTKNAERVILQSNKVRAPRPEMEGYIILAENAARNNDFEKAYKMAKNAQKIAKTMRILDLSNQLTIIESSNNLEIQYKEKTALEKVNKSQAHTIALGSLLIVAAFVLLILVVRHNRVLQKNQQKEHELTLKLRQQQDAILSRNKDLAEMITHRDRLYSIVAHDLKSPIAALHGLMQSLTEEDLHKEDTLELLRKVAPSVQSTYELIEKLVEWAQTQHMELKPNAEVVNLYQIYQGAIIHIAPFINRKKITINARLAVNHEVFFDRGMLLSIMRSLLSNAVKFTNEGGSIELRSLPDFKGFTITNSGMRIPDAVIEAINTNQTVESSFGTAGEKGTGLGLIIIRTLLDTNGGSIEFSTDETGTKVVVYLPRE